VCRGPLRDPRQCALGSLWKDFDRMLKIRPCCLGTLLLCCLTPTKSVGASHADPAGARPGSNLLTIDATAPVQDPQPVAALGSSRSPSGVVLTANSQYLTLGAHPWLPVMGEFHFSRYPESEWEDEILKMKEAGVDVIATYVIWIHHEEREGQFEWSGQRDLRRFIQLCAKYGMYVYPRIGPWAHAEARNGGLPDWVLKRSPVRRNDPIYLEEVKAFYTQIATQLHGLLWKDGGPVIGIQIENEYRGSGPGSGSEHIVTLKHMAVEMGLDVPLYTVTGWDGAAVPLKEVLPVYGGYTDAPWDSSPYRMPPNEAFAFRFDNRAGGSMGILGGMARAPPRHTVVLPISLLR
jgi:beta-galactosidase